MPATSKKMIEAQNQHNARVRLRRILFATDFSAASKLAMPFAAKLADRVGARLFVMNVQEPVNYALPAESWNGLDIPRAGTGDDFSGHPSRTAGASATTDSQR